MCTSIYNIHNVMETINHFSKYFGLNHRTTNGTLNKKYSFAFGFVGEPWSDAGILLDGDKQKMFAMLEKEVTKLASIGMMNKESVEDVHRLKNLPSHQMQSEKELDKWRKMSYDYVTWMNKVRGFDLRMISQPIDNLMRLYD